MFRSGRLGYGSFFNQENGMNRVKNIGPEATNGAAAIIETSQPYRIEATLRGESDMLFHRWNCEAVAAKAVAAKGSKAKKTDDIESFVYRDDAGRLCVPGSYLRGAIVGAAKFKQDPRSPRKSACDLVKAAVVCLTPLASLGVSKWDYEHACRVTIQRNAITRIRPALKAGWTAKFVIQVTMPEYVSQELLHALLSEAGRSIGLADFRPTYGRFQIVRFDLLTD